MMNVALLTARSKGYLARKEGKPILECPYPDHRTEDGRNSVTWSRAFRRSWQGGWRDEDALLATEEKHDG
jgi:ribosome modulation factor